MGLSFSCVRGGRALHQRSHLPSPRGVPTLPQLVSCASLSQPPTALDPSHRSLGSWGFGLKCEERGREPLEISRSGLPLGGTEGEKPGLSVRAQRRLSRVREEQVNSESKQLTIKYPQQRQQTCRDLRRPKAGRLTHFATKAWTMVPLN